MSKRVIYKYPLPVFNGYPSTVIVSLPKSALFVSIKLQNNIPVLYMLVNPDYTLPTEDVTFILIATGQEFEYDDEKYKFYDTLMFDTGLVFHLFEIKREG